MGVRISRTLYDAYITCQESHYPGPSSSKPDEANPRLVENFNHYLFTVKEGFFTRVRFKEK